MKERSKKFLNLHQCVSPIAGKDAADKQLALYRGNYLQNEQPGAQSYLSQHLSAAQQLAAQQLAATQQLAAQQWIAQQLATSQLSAQQLEAQPQVSTSSLAAQQILAAQGQLGQHFGSTDNSISSVQPTSIFPTQVEGMGGGAPTALLPLQYYGGLMSSGGHHSGPGIGLPLSWPQSNSPIGTTASANGVGGPQAVSGAGQLSTNDLGAAGQLSGNSYGGQLAGNGLGGQLANGSLGGSHSISCSSSGSLSPNSVIAGMSTGLENQSNPQQQVIQAFYDVSGNLRISPQLGDDNRGHLDNQQLQHLQNRADVLNPLLASMEGLGGLSQGLVLLGGGNNSLPYNKLAVSSFAGQPIHQLPVRSNPGGAILLGSVLQDKSQMLNKGNRSKLLEDFRNSLQPSLTLADLGHHVVEFCRDQHGSRYIQQKLERADLRQREAVFQEILPEAYSLMSDVFGNYVIQKYFEFGTTEQKSKLVNKMTGHVMTLTLQMYGCRVLQKAMESITLEQQKIIAKELDGHVTRCIKDQNGNHVVQKCIERISDTSALQFIVNSLAGQVGIFATHPYGCRVIQRILEFLTKQQTAGILNEIFSSLNSLILDQYGNYVIQHVMEKGSPQERQRIVGSLFGRVQELAMHKFASNVVEKCVEYANSQDRTRLVAEMINDSNSQARAPGQAAPPGDAGFASLLRDQYANYVIQKMIDLADANQRNAIIQKIRPHVASLKKFTYGKHIISKVEKYLSSSQSES